MKDTKKGEDAMAEERETEEPEKEEPAKKGKGGRKRRAIELRPARVWGEMDRMFDDVQRDMEEFFTRPRWWLPGGLGFPVRRPALNIRDEGKSLVVTAELPGVAKEDINLNITDDTLEIRAETRKETEEKEEGFVRRERSAKSFQRYVMLPAAVDPDHAEASLVDGVLRIDLPKRVPTRSRKVQVD